MDPLGHGWGRLLPALGLVLVAAGGGCQCGLPGPTAVTFEVRNTSSEALFVDDTRGALGVSVRRGGLGGAARIDQPPACECSSCERACGPCDGCLEPLRQVRRIEPGEVLTRPWDGLAHAESLASCGALVGGVPCVGASPAPSSEPLEAELCYARSAPAGSTFDGGVALAALDPKALDCVATTFRPADERVELTPSLDATPCGADDPCEGDGELCLGGVCTRSCPQNAFPELGPGHWLSVGAPEDRGFFDRTTTGGITRLTGSGTVTALSFQGQAVSISIAGARGSATLFVSVPRGYEPTVAIGEVLTAQVVDASSQERPETRALGLRAAGGALLFAADMASPSPLLTELSAPFTVRRRAEVVGCLVDLPCGKRRFHATEIAAPDGASYVLAPGQGFSASTADGVYEFFNVGNYEYESTPCGRSSLMPYVIRRSR